MPAAMIPKDMIPADMIPKAPPLTISLIACSIVVYLAITLMAQLKAPLLISEYIRPTLPEIQDGQWWRLITPIFLHFSIFHLVFNLLWLWEFARLIEWRQGAVRLLVVVVCVGVCSNLAQYFVSGARFGGLSGVVYGLFGYCWILGMIDDKFGIKLNPNIVKLLLAWLVICWVGAWTGLAASLFGIDIANTAHTVGLLSGILCALLASAILTLAGRN